MRSGRRVDPARLEAWVRGLSRVRLLVVGDDAGGHRASAMLGELGVDPGGLVLAAGSPAAHEIGILARAVARLRRRIGGGAVAVTRGSAGTVLFDDREPGTEVHAVAREVFDVQGAGDTTVAAPAPALRVGALLFEAAVVVDAAAGVVVNKVGVAAASADEVCRRLPGAAAAAQGEA